MAKSPPSSLPTTLSSPSSPPSSTFPPTTTNSPSPLSSQIAETFIQSWSSASLSTTTLSTFLSQFSPDIEWYDHAFFIQHRGHAGMAAFRTGWHRAMRDFRAEIVRIDSLPARGSAGVREGGISRGANAEGEEKGKKEETGKEEIVIRCIYDGIMVGDLPGRKASGRRFRTNVLIILRVGGGGVGVEGGIDGQSEGAGKIERVDEYYTATLDEGCDVEEYKLVGSGGRGKGGSKKVERGKGRGAEKL